MSKLTFQSHLNNIPRLDIDPSTKSYKYHQWHLQTHNILQLQSYPTLPGTIENGTPGATEKLACDVSEMLNK
ncbi:MAG: hypothetical protein ABIS01_06735 [Ferruginibacter sp.]